MNDNIIIYESSKSENELTVDNLIPILKNISKDGNGKSKILVCDSNHIGIYKIRNHIIISNNQY